MPGERQRDERERSPTDPTRVKTFASFFKNYMSVSAVLAAALPIPVTSFRLIPTYGAHTSLLAIYTSLFCFLLLGFIFYSRHSFARLMFPEFFDRNRASRSHDIFVRRYLAAWVRLLPGLLIMASLVFVFYYHSLLDQSLKSQVEVRPAENQIPAPRVEPSPEPSANNTPAPQRIDNNSRLIAPHDYRGVSARQVLDISESWEIPNGQLLIILYLAIFLSAESAFVVMALKEYLQDLVKLSEFDLIRGPA